MTGVSGTSKMEEISCANSGFDCPDINFNVLFLLSCLKSILFPLLDGFLNMSSLLLLAVDWVNHIPVLIIKGLDLPH
jgi:hypothetical protein